MKRLKRFFIEIFTLMARSKRDFSIVKNLLKFITLPFTFHESPILFVGWGRSGTTLLISILFAHPDIHAIPLETSAFYPEKGIKIPRSPSSMLLNMKISF